MIFQIDDNDPLVKWLRSLSCDDYTVKKFLEEEYSMEDVLQFVNRKDLEKMNLR